MLRRRAEQESLSAAQVQALLFLKHSRSSAHTMAGLAKGIALAYPTTSAMVDALERKGLVQRRVLESDRRTIRLHLTPEGEKLSDDFENLLDELEQAIQSLPQAQQESLNQAVRQIIYRLNAAGYIHSDGKGNALSDYLAAVRKRFGQWILDTCNRPYDQAWLDYQQEIGLRHHRTKKNQTDGVKSVEHIPLRYFIGFIYPITATIKSFLTKKGHSADEVDKMHQSSFKSVVLQVALWSAPYVKAGDH